MTVAFQRGAPRREVRDRALRASHQMAEVQHTQHPTDNPVVGSFANGTTSGSQEELSATIVESFSEVIIPFSIDGTIAGWNGAATELLGYTADEAIGRPWQFLICSADAGSLERAGWRLQKNERSVRVTARLRRKDGVDIETLFLMSTVRDRAGNLIGFSGMFRDLTQQRLAEKKIRSEQEKFKTVFKHSSDAISLASLPDG